MIIYVGADNWVMTIIGSLRYMHEVCQKLYMQALSHENCNQMSSGGHDTIFYDTDVGLTNGTWPSSGVLEVYIEGKSKWGTVCSSNFNKGAADSACRQLGYTNAFSYTGVDNP